MFDNDVSLLVTYSKMTEDDGHLFNKNAGIFIFPIEIMSAEFLQNLVV